MALLFRVSYSFTIVTNCFVFDPKKDVSSSILVKSMFTFPN